MPRAETVVLLAALLAAAPARADEGPPGLEALLEETVVTTASARAETGDRVPGTALTLSAEEIRRHGLRTVAEAIRFLAVGATTDEWLASPGVGTRGLLVHGDLNSHVLVLIDGHAVNDQASGRALLDEGIGVPVELVDHIELVLGPGSVLYGGNAMLGVVHVFTRQGRDYRGLHGTAETEVGALARGALGAGAEFDLLGSRGALIVGAELYRFQESLDLPPIRAGADQVTGGPLNFGPRSPPGVWGGTWEQNRRDGASAYARATLGGLSLAGRAATYRNANPTIPRDFDSPETGDSVDQLGVDLALRGHLGERLTGSLRLYADAFLTEERQEHSSLQYCLVGQSGCDVLRRSVGRWAGAEAQSEFDWLGTGAMTTLVGADVRLRDVQFLADSIDDVTRDNPGSLSHFSRVEPAAGVYAQHVVGVGRAFSLNSGARYDAVPRFGSALSPRLAAVVTPWERGAVKLVSSSAFRAPTVTEQYFATPTGVVPSALSRPETVRSLELTLEQRVGTQRLILGAFYSRFRELARLARLGADEELAARGRGELLPFAPDALQLREDTGVTVRGGLAGWDGAALGQRLRAGASVTLAEARAERAGGAPAPIPASPELFGNARVSYELGGALPTLALAGHLASASPVFGVADGGFPGDPRGPLRAVLRTAVTGKFPFVELLSYRAFVDLGTGDGAPVLVGPVTRAVPGAESPTLVPLHTLRVGLALRADLDL